MKQLSHVLRSGAFTLPSFFVHSTGSRILGQKKKKKEPLVPARTQTLGSPLFTITCATELRGTTPARVRSPGRKVKPSRIQSDWMTGRLPLDDSPAGWLLHGNRFTVYRSERRKKEREKLRDTFRLLFSNDVQLGSDRWRSRSFSLV